MFFLHFSFLSTNTSLNPDPNTAFGFRDAFYLLHYTYTIKQKHMNVQDSKGIGRQRRRWSHWMRAVSSSRSMPSPCRFCWENGDLSPNSLQFRSQKWNQKWILDTESFRERGLLEEEPFEKGVTLHAGEEEGLGRRVGSWVVQHRQFLLYLFHLLRRH